MKWEKMVHNIGHAIGKELLSELIEHIERVEQKLDALIEAQKQCPRRPKL